MERIVSQEFDPFSIAEPPDEVRAMSNLLWREVGKDRYRADFPKSDEASRTMRGYMEIQPDMIGNWNLTLTHSAGKTTQLRNYNNLQLVFQAANSLIRRGTVIRRILKDLAGLPSSNTPALPMQIDFLRRFGVEVAEDLTRGQADAALKQVFKQRRLAAHRARQEKLREII